jgi:hypothetical protein
MYKPTECVGLGKWTKEENLAIVKQMQEWAVVQLTLCMENVDFRGESEIAIGEINLSCPFYQT